MFEHILDLFRTFVALMPKLVAWKSQNFELGELFFQKIHSLEILDGCASQGGNVLNEDNFVFHGAKLEVVIFSINYGEIVK